VANHKPLVESGGELGNLLVADQLDVPLEQVVDVPVYSGSAKKVLAVNTGETAPEWISHQGVDGAGTNTHAQIDSHIANLANPHGITGNEDLVTGIISGGLVTINGGDATLVDVAAGVGLIVDWTSGSSVRTPVPFGPFIGEAIPDITKVFTHFYVNAAGGLVKISGVGPTAIQRKTLIRLQSAIHGGAVIDDVSTDRGLGFQVTATILDYLYKIGALNTDNRFFANGANLQCDKTSGTTTLPFVNATNDTQDAATKINPSVSPAANLPVSYRDGVGGFTFNPALTTIDPDLWDNGSGTLQSVTTNDWTVIRFHHFGLTNTWVVTPGQAVYNTLAQAEASVNTENPTIDPALETGESVLTTFLVVKEGTTDLSNASNAVFLNNVSLNGGAGTGQVAGTYLGLLDTADVDYVGHATHVPVVDGLETKLALTRLNHATHLDGIGVNSHAVIDAHITSHNHTESDITDLGTYQPTSEKNAANGYVGLNGSSKIAGTQQFYGAAADTACVGNDGRLSDARTPTAHTHVEADITDRRLDGRTFTAGEMVSTFTSDWVVSAMAPLADGADNFYQLRLMDDTVSEGAGFHVDVPSDAVNMTITTRAVAIATPAGAVTATMQLHFREIADNASQPAWNAAENLTTIDLAANIFLLKDTTTQTITAWGLTAGRRYIAQIVRTGGTLVGDLGLESVAWECTA